METTLYTRYPAIFAERHLSKMETCMCWGICCDDGWFPLIDQLCTDLQRLTNVNGDPQIVAAQVKEKFGDLRFYIHDASDTQRALIATASKQSRTICELCGAPNARQHGRWEKTRCDVCLNK